MHSEAEQFSIGKSLPRPASSTLYPVVSRGGSPVTHLPDQTPRFSQDQHVMDLGYPGPYGHRNLSVGEYNPSISARSQSLDASLGKSTRKLIIGIDFVRLSKVIASRCPRAKVGSKSGHYI